ncbi:MAG: GyrI-like domain-containing protein [Meiothermus sp.]|nr:GyrI-like domain-containing protein [Meiothermus sp.]
MNTGEVRLVSTGLEDFYQARTTPEWVEVPAAQFLMIDGQGDPNTSEGYHQALEALYALAYGLKFALKKAGGQDYKVGPLEGLWWAEDMAEFGLERKGDWRWTMMIAQPAAVTPERLEQLRGELRRKKHLPALDKVRLEPFCEGHAAQVLHLGPYSAEGPTVQKLHGFIHAGGCRFDGRVQKHHEIYLGDPRKSRPDRLKTVLRQPVR